MCDDLKKWDDEKFEFTGQDKTYLISNYGRVISLYFNKTKEIAPFEQSGKRKYQRVKLSINKKRYVHLVHRLVAETFIPNTEYKPEVNHINGIKNDNRASNLEWVTRGENLKHAYSTGLREIVRGENHPKSKLTERVVRKTKEMIRSGHSIVSIAKHFDVSIDALYKVKSGNTWGHVK